jgi:hypothetical protein
LALKSKLRREVEGFFTGRDWLEGGLTILGMVFLALGTLFAVLFVVVLVTHEPSKVGFPVSQGVAKESKLLALIVLPVLSAVLLLVGWWFARSWVGNRVRSLRRRGPGER